MCKCNRVQEASVQEVVLCEKGSNLVKQLVQVFLQWKVEGKPVYSSLKELG